MFVYTLKLNTNNYHHNRLARRFKMAQDIYRKSIIEILKRESKQKKDPRNTLNPRQNIRLYDVDDVIVKTSYQGIETIKELIRPVDFDWRKLIHEYEIKKDKPIEVIINLELGISVIQSIEFFIESGEQVIYSL